MLRFFKRRDSVIDEPITEVLSRMNKCTPDSEGYTILVDHLERLNKMKAEERQHRISPDTMAIVGGNLLGILVIVIYEQRHVMVSKGLNFVLQAKPHTVR
jgi:hypothetical protein